MNRIELLKSLDSVLGRFGAALLPAAKLTDIPDPKKILIIRPGGIGDAVLLIPTITRLHRAYPAAAISILAEDRNASIFMLSPFEPSVYRYNKPAELAKTLFLKPDLLIDTEQWHRLTAIINRLCRPTYSIGYASNQERQRLFSAVIPYDHDKYEGQSFFDLLAPLGINATFPKETFLTIPDHFLQQTAKILPVAGAFAALFPGASIPQRRWGNERFRAVVKSLANKNIPVIVIGGPEDRQGGEKIVAGISTAHNLAGRTSLLETAAIIKQSAILISGDSGILHIGVGLGKPTVSLFGPGIALKWSPRGSKHIVINKNLPCSPCTKFGYTAQCPRNAACMRAITVEEVITAALDLLAQSQ